MMTASKNEFLAIVFLLVAIIFSSVERTPAPVEVTQPEQSPYAVLYFVCGALQHVLMTDEPPTRADIRQPMSPELRDLLEATPEERIVELRYVGPECFYSEQPAPEKPIL